MDFDIPINDPTGGGVDFNLVDPLDTGGLDADFTTMLPVGGGGDSSWLTSLINAVGGPGVFNALLGAIGPTAGLIGTLAGGGQTGSQQQTSGGSSSQQGQTSQTGQSSSQQSGTSSQLTGGTSNLSGTSSTIGTTNQTQTGSQTSQGSSRPVLDPRADAMASQIMGMLGGGGPDSPEGALYSQALARLAAGGGGMAQPTAPNAPNTTPRPAPVTGFPDRLPLTYNEELGNLIKQAFGTFAGDAAQMAITDARKRGFAGGADLLNTAGSPIAGPALARMPADMAAAYLNHVLSAYTAQGNVAAQKNAAQAQALNAATNALGPATSVYGSQASMYNAQLQAAAQQAQQQLSLINAMMNPRNQLLQYGLGLMNSLPHGTDTMSGTQSSQTLSGTNTSNTTQNQTGSQTGFQVGQSASQQSGQNSQQGTSSQTGSSQSNTNQSQNVPLAPAIIGGLGNIIAGAGQGAARNM